MTFRDPRGPYRLDQVIHRAGRDAVHVSLLNDGRERLLRRAPRLQESGKVTAFAQLGDRKLNPAAARVPQPLAIAVAPISCSKGHRQVVRVRMLVRYAL